MSKRILTVDDSATMREMIAFTLQREGYQVDMATDGDHGLEMARKQPYDLILTDVNMPGRDGLTLVKDLRQIPSLLKVPILVLTTEATPEMKQRGREAGATGWIVKPFTPEKLVETLQKVL